MMTVALVPTVPSEEEPWIARQTDWGQGLSYQVSGRASFRLLGCVANGVRNASERGEHVTVQATDPNWVKEILQRHGCDTEQIVWN